VAEAAALGQPVGRSHGEVRPFAKQQREDEQSVFTQAAGASREEGPQVAEMNQRRRGQDGVIAVGAFGQDADQLAWSSLS
jgi:hypothetical protein